MNYKVDKWELINNEIVLMYNFKIKYCRFFENICIFVFIVFNV